MHRLSMLTILAFVALLSGCSLLSPGTRLDPKDPLLLAEIPSHSATEPNHRNDWLRKHEAINNLPGRSDMRLVFFGDSITEGWKGTGSEVWDQYYAHRNPGNFGIGGDQTQHLLWRMDNGNFDGVRPELVVLMIGTNNTGSNTSQEIADGVLAIMQDIRRRTPKTQILLLAIFPRADVQRNSPGIIRDEVNKAANAILATYDRFPGVHYLNINDVFLEDDGTLTRQIMPDLLHLSPEGYRRWAEAIEPTVARLLNE